MLCLVLANTSERTPEAYFRRDVLELCGKEYLMRRQHILAIIIGLAFAPVAILQTAAQEIESDFGEPSTAPQFEGVARPRFQDGMRTPGEGSVLQPYEVFFAEQYARIENLSAIDETPTFETEFMVVEVKQGIFGLQVGDNGTFIVDPAGESPIQIVNLPATPPYVEPQHKYVRNAAGNICTNMCALPLNTAVQVKPGDIVIAQANALCLWCLLHGTRSELDTETGPDSQAAVTPSADTGAVPDSGLLLVSVQLAIADDPDSFSWVQAWQTPPSAAATPSASGELTSVMSWAFNPPSGCN
jgi:hypothetical protein